MLRNKILGLFKVWTKGRLSPHDLCVGTCPLAESPAHDIPHALGIADRAEASLGCRRCKQSSWALTPPKKLRTARRCLRGAGP